MNLNWVEVEQDMIAVKHVAARMAYYKREYDALMERYWHPIEELGDKIYQIRRQYIKSLNIDEIKIRDVAGWNFLYREDGVDNINIDNGEIQITYYGHGEYSSLSIPLEYLTLNEADWSLKECKIIEGHVETMKKNEQREAIRKEKARRQEYEKMKKEFGDA